MTSTQKIDELVKLFKINQVYATRVLSEVDSLEHSIVQPYLDNKPKPFVKWVGGKRQLLGQFRDKGLYPPKEFDASKNTYFEPFVGGGAMFFDLLPLNASINDINAELVTTYKIIRDNVEDLITELTSGRHLYDKEIFLKIRAQDTNLLSDIERAARFIFLNRTAFNGMYRVNKSGQFNVPFGKYINPQICDSVNLRRSSKVLKNTKVSNSSYKYVLEEAKKGDFVYFDPPYYPVSKTASFTSYSNDVFLKEQQIELRDTYIELNNRSCFVMLSNSDTAFIESLFLPYLKSGINIHKVQAGRAINSNSSKRGKVSELLITNY